MSCSMMLRPLLRAAVCLLFCLGISSQPPASPSPPFAPSPGGLYAKNFSLPAIDDLDDGSYVVMVDSTLQAKRPHDIVHQFGKVADFDRDIFITMRIHESECFGADTESSFVVYLGSLSFENEFLGWHAIPSTDGIRQENGVWELETTYKTKEFIVDPENCFIDGEEACVPRADVIYIQFNNEPVDAWSISLVEVQVQFRLWHGGENWHIFKYEHSVLMPCQSWMDDVALYQIGPRVGFFHRLDEAPVPGQWVRDWV